MLIGVTLITVCIYAGSAISHDGLVFSQAKGITNQWYAAISNSAFAFEGIAVVLPIRDLVADKKGYFKVLCVVVSAICLFYVLYGDYCVAAYGNKLDSNDPMITTQLPPTSIVT